MSQFAIDQVLSQIRTLQASQRSALAPAANAISPVGGQGPAAASGPNFADVLKRGLDKVNQAQLSADKSMNAFERGVPGVELGQVMVDMQKAQVAFKATTEVRNRFVQAYQDIMNMPI